MDSNKAGPKGRTTCTLRSNKSRPLFNTTVKKHTINSNKIYTSNNKISTSSNTALVSMCRLRPDRQQTHKSQIHFSNWDNRYRKVD